MAYCEQNSTGIENWLRLRNCKEVGPITFGKLIQHFGTAENALDTSVKQLCAVDGIGSKTAESIVATRDNFNVAKELELAEKLGVWIINLEDNRYPVLLKKIYDPPPILYIKGSLTRQDNLAISIVGSRRCSLYGQEQASRFAYLLASAGITIVSGMARGIDTAAHQGALSAKARTIAVQGCGLANIFPPENKKLFELISESGACVSELPMTYEPLAENFPARNRIIAGLSLGAIVIEAGERSGALLTAKSAMENSREVMAVPGKIDSPLSKGAHRLIKEGARLVESVEDVMDAFGYIGEDLKPHTSSSAGEAVKFVEKPLFQIEDLNLSENEKIIYNCFDTEPLHIEQIISETALGVGGINASLISLRLKGLIKQLPGSVFAKNEYSRQ